MYLSKMGWTAAYAAHNVDPCLSSIYIAHTDDDTHNHTCMYTHVLSGVDIFDPKA